MNKVEWLPNDMCFAYNEKDGRAYCSILRVSGCLGKEHCKTYKNQAMIDEAERHTRKRLLELSDKDPAFVRAIADKYHLSW